MFDLSNYLLPLLGGILIGCSALLLMLVLGRIAGISGIASSLITKDTEGKVWRLVFILGIFLGAMLLQFLIPKNLPFRVELSTVQLVIAGLLVGFGAHFGGGCTSGHGVCGIGRFSIRSIVATITFMFTAAITVFIIRHLVGLS